MAILKLAVLGCGVIGVTTALELQSTFPNAEITIIAEKFNEETTSDGAAGIFRPGTSFSTSSEQLTHKIISDSFDYYNEIRIYNDPLVTGISERSGYIFSSTDESLVRNHLIEKIVPVYHRRRIKPFPWKLEARFLLYNGTDRMFKQSNGKVVKKKITNFSDVGDQYDVIINCLGLGAKYVCVDRKMVPIRGQVLKVSAPWLGNFFYAEYDTYIIPGLEYATLGGCRNYDSYDLKISRHDTAGIWERCTDLVPKLKESKIERTWVGLRPHRDPVRIEAEIIKQGSKSYKVIHNYGHGGYGVTTAPGSSKQAVKLTQQLLKSNSKL